MDISRLVGRYMAVIVLMAALLAFLIPDAGLWISTGWIDYLLMIVMFGMGLTIRIDDFKVVFIRPKDVIVGCIAQFTIMPMTAYVLAKAFGLEAGLMAGVILVGCCPGGTASNVISYFAKGDVALSVGMTAVNTLLAPLVTPFLVFLALNETVEVDTVAMFLSMAKVVLAPLILGFAITYLRPEVTDKASGALPLISVIAIALIVMCVISHSVDRLMTCGLAVFAVVALHNLIGYAAGYGASILAGMDRTRRRTLAIEVGMQNSGLATSIASTSFPSLAMATVPGAIFSVWHNISGAILAGFFSRRAEKEEQTKPSDR
ncbi:MAG: bile acid:sodium symporter family protein [Candidatus Methanomethylophilaceae archaeon]|nr:bile acid:sodium symporter family protein [Candidatus Methanomethylophilaceae archaeon]